ncbi:GHKL domain-containing protein [Blautia schinkii]|nr:GHKL domain-containing protein [Blautia schinkii]
MLNPNILWHVLQLLIFLVLSMYFLISVFTDSIIVKKPEFLVRLVLHIIALTVTVCLFMTEISPYLNHKLGILIIFLITYIFYRSVTKRKVIFLTFLLFVLINIQLNSLLLAWTTLDFHIFPHLIEYEYGDFMLLSSIYCIFMFSIVYFSLAKPYKRIVDENIVMNSTKFFLWLPALFFLTTGILTSTLDKIAGVTKEFLLPLALLNIFSIVAYHATLRAIVDNYDASLERERLSAVTNQLKLWETQYKTLHNKIDADARARHDWRQHIITIMGYVETKDLSGLDDYLSEYKEKYLFHDKPPVCDVLSLNMLFQYYQREADELGISLTINSVAFAQCPILVTDLTILFGNLLENAIEGCDKLTAKDKYIHLKILRKPGRLSFLCENPIEENLMLTNGKINSTKEDGGIGLSSIQGIVEKYDGQLKIDTTGQLFRIYAFLQYET